MSTGNQNPLGNPRLRRVHKPSGGNEQLENFKVLARKLVAVPKAEIDERREKA